MNSGMQSSLRLSWDEYFISLVDAAAGRATCDRGRCGAVFTRDNDILSTGYVGAPPGLPHCDDVGHLMSPDGLHCIRTIHAEQNAIIRAARNGHVLKNSTLYTTMAPCPTCAMMIIGVGVVRVVAKNNYHAADRTRDMFKRTHIKLEILSQAVLY